MTSVTSRRYHVRHLKVEGDLLSTSSELPTQLPVESSSNYKMCLEHERYLLQDGWE